MGQYYKPICLDTKEYIESWDSGAGAKLMESCYIGNEYIGKIMKLLTKGQSWHKKRMVFAGDYYGGKDSPEDNDKCWYAIASKKYRNLGDMIMPIVPLTQEEVEKSFIVNHTEKTYVDLSLVLPDQYGYKINPLTLLLALGNGRGGGDYQGEYMDLVGSWAKCKISVEFERPKGYLEIFPCFSEQ